MIIKITEKDFNGMKDALYFKNSISIHELVVALSEITYLASRSDLSKRFDKADWRKKLKWVK